MTTTILCVIILLLTAALTASILKGNRDTGRAAREAENLRNTLETKISAYADMNQQLLREQKEWADRHAEEMRQATIHQLSHMADQNLREHQADLRESNMREMERIMTPLKSKLDEFSRAVSDAYMNENASRKSLTDQITLLMQLNRDIGRDARNLTSALKGDSKVQGDWGETLLQTLLESAGLVKNVHFFLQVTADDTGRQLTDENGRRQRPDVVVNLSDGHRMVIDSKVSLTAYSRYVAAESEEEHNREGKLHLVSVKKHIDELATKQYQKQIRGAADHVLMFMPIEGSYYTAMQLDPDLWRYAFERNVAIVSPTHLCSVMQLVSQLWSREKQERNAEEIARQGGLLYDRVAAFLNEFATIGNSLDTVRARYDRCFESLTKGRQSVVARAERMRELGTPVKRRISSQLADAVEDYSESDESSQDIID